MPANERRIMTSPKGIGIAPLVTGMSAGGYAVLQLGQVNPLTNWSSPLVIGFTALLLGSLAAIVVVLGILFEWADFDPSQSQSNIRGIAFATIATIGVTVGLLYSLI